MKIKLGTLTHTYETDGTGPPVLILSNRTNTVDELRRCSDLDSALSDFQRIYPNPIGISWMPYGKINKFDEPFIGWLLEEFKPKILIGFGEGANRIGFFNYECYNFLHSPIQEEPICQGEQLSVVGTKNVFRPKSFKKPYLEIEGLGYYWDKSINAVLLEWIDSHVFRSRC